MQNYRNFKQLILSSLVSLISLSFTSVSMAATDADNSKQNKQIQKQAEMTSQNQGQSDSDIKLTQRIRQDIVKVDSFSMDAKNIKIITSAGKVILKEPALSH